MTYSSGLSIVHGTWESVAQDRAWAHAGARQYPEVTPYDVEAPARTLSSILDERGLHHIDFLSLDVEGYEPAALEGLDLTRHAPRFMLVEVWERKEQEVEALLGAMYDRIAELGRGEVEGARQTEVLYGLREARTRGTAVDR